MSQSPCQTWVRVDPGPRASVETQNIRVEYQTIASRPKGHREVIKSDQQPKPQPAPSSVKGLESWQAVASSSTPSTRKLKLKNTKSLDMVFRLQTNFPERYHVFRTTGTLKPGQEIIIILPYFDGCEGFTVESVVLDSRRGGVDDYDCEEILNTNQERIVRQEQAFKDIPQPQLPQTQPPISFSICRVPVKPTRWLRRSVRSWFS